VGILRLTWVTLACACLGSSIAPIAPPVLAVVATPAVVRTTPAAPGSPTAPTVAMDPLYPWGTDHNGTARMYATQVVTSADGVTTLTAVRDTNQTPAVSSHEDAGEHPPIHYRSGAVHSHRPVTIPARRMRISVEAQAPSVSGTWPAVWLTGVDSWPPEIDVLEYMGSNRLLQNVFSSKNENSRHVPTRITSPEQWHTYVAELTPYTTGDVLVEFSVDGAATGSVIAHSLVGARMWVIANLQTERWSGSTGPATATLRFRNLTIT
jgi:beta-glucanase (GH16 family)